MSCKFDVYVRAVSPQGLWVTCHVNDLEEASFRDFVSQIMCEEGMVVGVKAKVRRPLRTRADWEQDVNEFILDLDGDDDGG